jgi:hypothetical protein
MGMAYPQMQGYGMQPTFATNGYANGNYGQVAVPHAHHTRRMEHRKPGEASEEGELSIVR